MNLLRVIGGARLGEVTSVTISIPANDSPLGQFGFQELEVKLKSPCCHEVFLLSFNNPQYKVKDPLILPYQFCVSND